MQVSLAKVTDLTPRLAALEARLNRDSHNSHQPPSSDGPGKPRRARCLRKGSGKKSGGRAAATVSQRQRDDHSDRRRGRSGRHRARPDFDPHPGRHAARRLYPLLLGLYDSVTQERRVLVTAQNPLPDSRAIIGSLTVTAP